MSLSWELQIGRAGEHLVVADLIMQGYNAFLSAQGLPYDLVVETPVGLKRIQVKATTKLQSFPPKVSNIYRFGIYRGNQANHRGLTPEDADIFAFVALDIREVAYLSVSDLTTRSGKLKRMIDFKTRRIQQPGRVYSNGTVRTPEWGRYFEDFKVFKYE